jgi:signal transduction histidine kinase
MTGDHLVFLSVATVLIVSAINTVVLKRQHGWREGEVFWFFGLIALSISYVGFGSSVWLGRPALTIANLGLILAYLAMSLQLRYWRSGKTNVSMWLVVMVIVYTVLLETFRQYLNYTARLYLIHSVMTVITAYLFWSTIQYYRSTQSKQLILLAVTFAVEFLCASSRLFLALIQPEATDAPVTLYEEPVEMVVIRWVWLVANAMSYLTVMSFELEKTLNKNETLKVLIQEKNLLLNALSRINRSNNSAAIGRSLSHELRQPLTTLLLASKNLQMQLKSNDLSDLSMQVDFLCREIERSANLINQLETLFTRPRATTSSVNLAITLDNAIKTVSPRLTAENVSLTLQGDTDSIVAGESIQLETILINLISNSINALEVKTPPRKIEINVSKIDNYCVIEVSDNGPGIAPSMMPNLWQLYATCDKNGSGIGLWLSQQLAQSNGGHIEAGNNANVGAWFRVNLPMKNEPKSIST